MQTKIYDIKGKESGDINLPEEIFGLPWNADLVYTVLRSMRMNERLNIQHTKDRSEVSGSGKKPWAQKGTGRARHGSTRSPIWRHGGITFGPRNDRNFDRKINKKAKVKALNTILSAKFGDKELVFVDGLTFASPKTKDAQNVLINLSKVSGLEKLSYKKGNRALVLTPKKNDLLVKSFRNIPSAHVEEIRNLNPLLALKYKYLVFLDPKEALSVYKDRLKDVAGVQGKMKAKSKVAA